MISISLIQQGALCAGFGATLLLAPASLAQSKPQTPEPVPSSQPSTEESRPEARRRGREAAGFQRRIAEPGTVVAALQGRWAIQPGASEEGRWRL